MDTGSTNTRVKATSAVGVFPRNVDSLNLVPVSLPDQLPMKVSPFWENCQKHFSVVTSPLSNSGVSSSSYKDNSPIRLGPHPYHVS